MERALFATATLALCLGACSPNQMQREAIDDGLAGRQPAAPAVAAAEDRPVVAATGTIQAQGGVQAQSDQAEVLGWHEASPAASGRRRARLEILYRQGSGLAPKVGVVLSGVSLEPALGAHPLRGPAGGSGTQAWVTGQSDLVGTMRDFTRDVRGTLWIEAAPQGILAGRFDVTATEAPPPPPDSGTEDPSHRVGEAPPPPLETVHVTGSFRFPVARLRNPLPQPVGPEASGAPRLDG